MAHILHYVRNYKLHKEISTPWKHLRIILKSLVKILSDNLPGSVIEMGCYLGNTSVLFKGICRSFGRDFHVYDTFDTSVYARLLNKNRDEEKGIESLTEFDNNRNGKISSYEAFKIIFKRNKLPLPEIHRGLFSEHDDYPDEICFAFLDSNTYESITSSLNKIYHRMVSGGVIFIHDYGWEKNPGVKKACDDFFKSKPEDVITPVEYLGKVIKK